MQEALGLAPEQVEPEPGPEPQPELHLRNRHPAPESGTPLNYRHCQLESTSQSWDLA